MDKTAIFLLSLYNLIITTFLLSVWYYYINRTKKEYFSSLHIGYSLKEWPYVSNLLPLIGYLQIKYYNTSQDCDGNHTPEDDEDLVLIGHWAGDDCELISEHNPEYDDIIENKDKWTDISQLLLEDYNKNIVQLTEFWLDDDEKKALTIPVGPFGKHSD